MKTILNQSGTYSDGKDGYHVDAGTELIMSADVSRNLAIWKVNIGNISRQLFIPKSATVVSDNKDKLPAIMLYNKYLNIASDRFNLTIDECRNRYGRLTISEWETLLTETSVS